MSGIDDIVVDTGGNIGAFATYAATVCRASQAPVFEPFAENFSMLTRNIEENRLQTVTCVNEAVVGPEEGCRSLYTLRVR